MSSPLNAKTNNVSSELTGVQVTQSLYGAAIPLLVGTRRIAGKTTWYGDFGPAGGSGKKGKSAKKGINNYQANVDLLFGYGPIWTTLSSWSNAVMYAYGYGTDFTKMGSQNFAVTSGDYTANADGTYTYSNTVSNIDSGYSLDFISCVYFTPTTPMSATVDDYGDPEGSHTITETLTTQWLYNVYSGDSAGAQAWRPGSWWLGVPLCNSPKCTFPIGADRGGMSWTATLPAPTAGTYTVVWGETEDDHDNPTTYLHYEFEAELGSGNEYNSTPSQQIIYPELSGAGRVGIDLGATATAPELDLEVQGLYSLTLAGQASPADAILDLILSGNAYINNNTGLGLSNFTPLCFSHGLNFGFDPTHCAYADGANPGPVGSAAWPPTVAFPYVLPNNGQFQILRDSPAWIYSSDWAIDITYPVGCIVLYSGQLYQAIQINRNATPGVNDQWQLFTGTLSDGLMDVRNYCTANGIFMSMKLDSQRSARDVLQEICQVANCVPVWNGQTLDFYPLSEVSALGSGALYTPRTASGPLAVINSKLFVCEGNEAPVIVKQEGLQKVYNIVDITYADRGSRDDFGSCDYTAYQSGVPARITDAEHCQLYGPLLGSPYGFDDYICDEVTATLVGWPILKRQRFADPYTLEFRLPSSAASLLDPMDLFTVEDELFGGVWNPTGVVTTGPGSIDVRITSLEEDKSGVWTIEAERFIYGMSAPAAPSSQGTTPNAPPSQGALAGSVNTPYIFEPTAALGGQANSLWIAVSGSASNYGGCQVYVSTDAGSSYQLLGTIVGNPEMGVLTADYPNHANPDTANTLSVDLTESSGELQSWTSGQQDQLVPIALIYGGGSSSASGYTTTLPYEIVSYGSVTLTATSKYNLTEPILRGQDGTAPADHPSGNVFVNLANQTSIFKTTIPTGAIVGNTLYFKFASFNQYMSGTQDPSTCTAYSYVVTGQTNPGVNSSYTLTPATLLYQGRSGGWAGVDGSSTSWTNPDYVYWPSFVANFSTGAVTYAANDSGTSAFTGSGQTVYVTIDDPTRSGSGTINIGSTNADATTPGYIYLGQITSASTPTLPGSPGGSSGSGGPQDLGIPTYQIFVDGVPIT